ncbi:NAD(P)-dependent oxidoreductase [Microlunatus soli]|uniref:D-3-phosphoglycerate dehydrogenase n=1 Tax=Microlunatus soli TaxID=630515 RepID=A0A1H1PX37_9ACTN|nr:NAD(P)-dependent oxidoreductase [Microlunatus soli]SDS15683.1 D-3-phosphoglycerate dehydrogenase [Microlunatus soli]
MTRVLVTPRSMTQHDLDDLEELAPLRERGFELISGPPGRLPSEDELTDLVRGVDGWIAGVETITATVLDNADRLRVISRNGVGADAIDERAAKARGVQILLARGSNARGVAELTLGLLLTAVRDIPAAVTAMRAARWERTLGTEVADHTVGIVGYGSIGRIVADLVTAIGGRVLAHDAYATVPAELAVPDLSALFRCSTVVTLHTPPPADGTPLVTAELIAAMRPGSVLINTARAGLIDEAAALQALESGRLRSYAVDAFASEPPELTPLLTHPHTIMTPHLGGYTDASVRRATVGAVDGLLSVLS